MIEIDGSFGEGGGQIIRTAIAFSSLTRKPCRIFNIRKGRQNPGLAAQHLTALKAVSEICEAVVHGASIGSQEFTFEPHDIKGGGYSWDIGTAGSVTLVLEALLPAAIHSGKEFDFTIKGGTNVPWSPPAEYFQHVFCGYLKKMGANISLNIQKHGFYPKGGGIVNIKIEPSGLKRIDITERGELEKIDVCSIASLDLKKANVAERQVQGFLKMLPGKKIGKVDEMYVDTDSPGSSIHAHAHFENCKIGSEALGERQKKAEDVGKECAKKLILEMDSASVIDSNMLDQILPYLALAKGSLRFDKMTSHARTNMQIIEKFLPMKFTVDENNKLVSVKSD